MWRCSRFGANLTCDFIHHVLGGASALQPVAARAARSFPRATGRGLQRRVNETFLDGLIILPRRCQVGVDGFEGGIYLPS